MPKTSAGLIMYRIQSGQLEVLLVHPGGPLWADMDAGAWSIPKGEVRAGEDALTTARREFEEETGIRPEGGFRPLAPIRQKSGKIVHAWAFEGDCDPSAICSNVFVMEWPPRSGRKQPFPEVDRAAFFPVAEAKKRMNPAQCALVDQLQQLLAG